MSHSKHHTKHHAELRHALGMFATGVAVVTTIDATGEPLGLTINSFNSVSLDPPLIVWSLARHLACVSVFDTCKYYAVNILSASQQIISQRFASKMPNKFADIEYSLGQSGVPLFPDCCAWFEVENSVRHDGGDHLLFLGEIKHFSSNQSQPQPLIFYGGQYRHLQDPNSK